MEVLFFRIVNGLLCVVAATARRGSRVAEFCRVVRLVIVRSRYVIDCLGDCDFTFARVRVGFPRTLRFLCQAHGENCLVLRVRLGCFLSYALANVDRFCQRLHVSTYDLTQRRFRVEVSGVHMQGPVSREVNELDKDVSVEYLVNLFRYNETTNTLVLVVGKGLSCIYEGYRKRFDQEVVLSPRRVTCNVTNLASRPPDARCHVDVFPCLVRSCQAPARSGDGSEFSDLYRFQRRLLLPLKCNCVRFKDLLTALARSLTCHRGGSVQDLDDLWYFLRSNRLVTLRVVTFDVTRLRSFPSRYVVWNRRFIPIHDNDPDAYRVMLKF